MYQTVDREEKGVVKALGISREEVFWSDLLLFVNTDQPLYILFDLWINFQAQYSRNWINTIVLQNMCIFL